MNLRDPIYQNWTLDWEIYLTGDVSVTNDFTGAVESGWGAVIGKLGICEVTQFHVGCDDLDVERRVSGDVLIMLGENDQR